MVAKNIAFLFPGQGAQYPGMAADLMDTYGAARDLVAAASEGAGMDIATLLRTADAEKLKRTDVSQVAITAANLAAAAVLRGRGVEPCAAAGFSLGEYAALATASVISVTDCFLLVAARGAAMQAAVEGIAAGTAASSAAGGAADAGMAAVLGLTPERVESLIAEWTGAGLVGLYSANFNSPKQVVVAGSAAALAEAEKRFKEAGARRVLRLQVAGPFHSPLVAAAADTFGPVLESVHFSDPALPLFSNVTGSRVDSGAEAKRLALRQITEPVRWTVEEEALAAQNLDAVLEVGPGKVLQGLWKETDSSVPIYGAGTAADLNAAVEALGAPHRIAKGA